MIKLVHIDEIVSLNVGGTIYSTTKSTLLKYPGTLFSTLFESVNSSKDEAGNYFLDRDGFSFSCILNYLRTGQFPELSRNELIDLREEAEFYGISPLVKALDNCLGSVMASKFAVLRYNENNTYNNLSWQGMTEPCNLKIGHSLYKCIDDVLTEVDSRGWELMQLGGDGNAEGGWKYVFRKRPNFTVSIPRPQPDTFLDTSGPPVAAMTERLNIRKSSIYLQRPFRRKKSDSF